MVDNLDTHILIIHPGLVYEQRFFCKILFKDILNGEEVIWIKRKTAMGLKEAVQRLTKTDMTRWELIENPHKKELDWL